jgi:hypothetical protein
LEKKKKSLSTISKLKFILPITKNSDSQKTSHSYSYQMTNLMQAAHEITSEQRQNFAKKLALPADSIQPGVPIVNYTSHSLPGFKDELFQQLAEPIALAASMQVMPHHESSVKPLFTNAAVPQNRIDMIIDNPQQNKLNGRYQATVSLIDDSDTTEFPVSIKKMEVMSDVLIKTDILPLDLPSVRLMICPSRNSSSKLASLLANDKSG